METIEFTVRISGLPKKNVDQLMIALQRDFMKKFGILFEPTVNIEISYDPKNHTSWEGCQQIIAHSLTHKVLEDEIKNGN